MIFQGVPDPLSPYVIKLQLIKIIEPQHEISINVKYATGKGSNQSRKVIRAVWSEPFLNLFDYLATDRQAFDVSKLERETAQARLSLFMLECHIVGSHN